MLKRTAMFALLFASLACAKTYTFTITDPMKAGEVQLAQGEYKLEVVGSDAVLKDQNGHRIDAKARVEDGEPKNSQTSVVTSNRDGVRRIEYIQLGGKSTRVVFE